MNLKTQRRLAANILKIGTHRVQFDPEDLESVDEAVTREDIRRLIHDGVITAKPIQGISRFRARKIAIQKKKGRRQGQGKRSGTKYARFPKKRRWISTIRPIRIRLKQMRADGELEPSQYRKLYNKAKGGIFKSKAHLESFIKERGV